MAEGKAEFTCELRGVVKYPWGVLKGAAVAVGEKSTTSDSAGAYEIGELTPGAYDVTVKPPFPGYAVSPQKVELLAAETKVVDIYLDYEKTVVEGHVYDENGKPITGATLSGVLSGKEIETMTSDEQGHFSFEGVTPGDRFIRVNAPGYMAETRDFMASKDKTTSLEFRLASATCKIHGTVTDQNGKPTKAEVRLRQPPSGVILQNSNSNEDGHYEFLLSPGDYQVLATAPSHEVEPWKGSIQGDTEVNFRLGLHKVAPPVGGCAGG